jgi:hypothetical protein
MVFPIQGTRLPLARQCRKVRRGAQKLAAGWRSTDASVKEPGSPSAGLHRKAAPATQPRPLQAAARRNPKPLQPRGLSPAASADAPHPNVLASRALSRGACRLPKACGWETPPIHSRSFFGGITGASTFSRRVGEVSWRRLKCERGPVRPRPARPRSAERRAVSARLLRLRSASALHLTAPSLHMACAASLITWERGAFARPRGSRCAARGLQSSTPAERSPRRKQPG